MSRITPLLYLGGAQEAQNKSFLESKNIRLIVNAAMEIPDYFPRHFEYLRLELDDHPSQDLSHVLDPAALKIINYLRNGKGVYVHCAAGISRSTSIIIYTLMKMHNWNYDRAFKFLKIVHPRTQPNYGFIEQLVRKNTSGNRQTTTSVLPPSSQIETFVDFEDQPPPLEPIQNKNPPKISEGANPHQELVEPPILKKIPISKYKKMDPENKSDTKNKEWTQLTFDCPECEQPAFTPTRRGVYARIFT